jgi:hypothetical protein
VLAQRTRPGEQSPEVEAEVKGSVGAVLVRCLVSRSEVAADTETPDAVGQLACGSAGIASDERQEGIGAPRGVTAPVEGKALKGWNSMSAPA